MNVSLEVQGKGAGYLSRLEVFPDERVSVLAKKVKFYKMFFARGFQIYAESLDKYLDTDFLQETTFKDSGLKNGDKLIMKEAPRQRQNSDGEIVSLDEQMDDEELEMEFEEGMIGEGGEDELIDMDAAEEGELEMDQSMKMPDDPDADADEAQQPEDQPPIVEDKDNPEQPVADSTKPAQNEAEAEKVADQPESKDQAAAPVEETGDKAAENEEFDAEKEKKEEQCEDDDQQQKDNEGLNNQDLEAV